MDRDLSNRLRTLLGLSRLSGLPTVWSSCIAGWWLGGGGNFWKLSWLLTGMSAIYLGGCFLNDVFDVEFDRQFNLKRPIPLGVITRQEVLNLASAWLALGGLCLFPVGFSTGLLGLILIGCVVIYDALHRTVTISPWLLGLCRFLAYPIAAAAGFKGISGLGIWFGVSVGVYATGCGFFARRKSSREQMSPWPIAFLGFPVFFALLINAGAYRQTAVMASMALMAWTAFCIRPLFQQPNANRRSASAGLFAGIILVDWLAVAPLCPPKMHAIFAALFGFALLAQRFVDR